MADYLLVYEGGDPEWTRKSPEQMRTVMEQWTAWFKELESKGVLRNPGSALAPGGVRVRRNGSGFATDASLPEVKELIGGFSIVRADSLDQAAKIAEGSPFLRNNPSGHIEVRQIFEPQP